jgi:phospholipid N-methyltransferase
MIIKEFFRNPRSTGAVMPSSGKLAKVITSEIGLKSARRVIELGPGTGAITRHILEGMEPGTEFFAVELNEKMYETFKHKFPGVKIINENAASLRSIIVREGMQDVDLIISGLPWASFGAPLQRRLLLEITGSLAPRGIFTTFAYVQGLALPSARAFKRRLDKRFATVQRTPIIWNNIPPAVVYRCRK